jgi:hypothetical protein
MQDHLWPIDFWFLSEKKEKIDCFFDRLFETGDMFLHFYSVIIIEGVPGVTSPDHLRLWYFVC